LAIKSEGNHARRPRRNHTPAFKSKVALAAGKGDQTIVELSQQFDVHVNQITQWKTRLLERAGVVFEGGGRAESPPVDLEALEEAIACYGPLEIMNTDQGGQFTSQAFTGVVKDHGIRISMDGKGAWRDNVFVERLWRSVKYEEVYLHACDAVSDSRTGLGRYFDLYNRRRSHSGPGRKTPDQVYFSQPPLTLAA